jgi:hypothetical protein
MRHPDGMITELRHAHFKASEELYLSIGMPVFFMQFCTPFKVEEFHLDVLARGYKCYYLNHKEHTIFRIIEMTNDPDEFPICFWYSRVAEEEAMERLRVYFQW